MTRRYCRVRRLSRYHVGIYDRVLDRVLHVTNKNGRAVYNFDTKEGFDEVNCGIVESDWNIHRSDRAIEKDWQEIEANRFAIVASDGTDITHIYDCSGLRGLNCENIVELLLTGELRVLRGNLGKPFRRIGLLTREGKLVGGLDLGFVNRFWSDVQEFWG